jgi:hypothetical protein
MLDAPRYRIQALLDGHLRAQATLRECRDSGRPFALFLRSFATEHRTERIDTLFASHMSTDSVRFQRWLSGQLAPAGSRSSNCTADPTH